MSGTIAPGATHHSLVCSLKHHSDQYQVHGGGEIDPSLLAEER